ncbi:S-(hydroxymethyl)glutathione dehydrogenase/class III alcohol dehydrogenase [Oecophyllibacter saccharovorans]|uniref:S-(hydroxymethyl)glutathione dehydrogenase/class III alcohol dehydrogenase n=1 Tax=Oecophyllibacter saccharovorans TaxID=2558360 RepID=UPI0011743EAB|nr:S-(hydroxymethyl)glutathione dehydrogenase/class III alcohol dehydrogenase [Oecophyllibacter saccharovorans]TPW35315.1 S-(hydroxymethyl)glutathione dehydrogenase/class III alcohol dehydrogenase [Oecophyllibacter saccharovorans]
MDVRAAIALEPGKPLVVDTVQLEGPRDGEVLIEIMATGICHTDKYTLSGQDPEGVFPAILGHEGAGIVRKVGKGVTSVKPGDHVIPVYIPECRQCPACLSQKTNLCTAIRTTQGRGLMPDGTTRFSYKGKPVHNYMGCSTFANFTVVPEIAVAKIRPDAPFDRACYVGCGVTTGVGSVIWGAKVEPNSTVAVFGLGGIGLNVIQGAKMVGARQIVGVDINPARAPLAEKFGMTDFLNPAALPEGEDVVSKIIEMTGGGADYTFECIGNVTLMRQALESAHRGWGVACVIGVAAAGQEISTRPFQLITGRKWMGTAYGGARGRTDTPKVVDMYMEGRVDIDDLITNRIPLEKINEAFEMMGRGEGIRTVVDYSL